MRLLAMCVGLCLVFLFVWERVDMVRVGYQVERLKQEKTLLERERDQLRIKVSTLSAPDRVAKVAMERLGMAPPQRGQVIVVQAGPLIVPPMQGAPVELRVAKHEPIDVRR
ncbi:MAG TPA: cell division protein FtsL [Nitrospira sp.]|nr:cell division protein FtsL [Nitrospira sp.]